MDNYLICDCHLFLPSKIYRVTGNQTQFIESSSLDELGSTLATLCRDYGLHKVKFSGSRNFLKKIIADMQEVAMCRYDYYDIESEYL